MLQNSKTKAKQKKNITNIFNQLTAYRRKQESDWKVIYKACITTYLKHTYTHKVYIHIQCLSNFNKSN